MDGGHIILRLTDKLLELNIEPLFPGTFRVVFIPCSVIANYRNGIRFHVVIIRTLIRNSDHSETLLYQAYHSTVRF